MRKAVKLTKREQRIKERDQLLYRHNTIKEMLARALSKLARIETTTANMEVFMQNHFAYFYPRPRHFKDHDHDLSYPAGEHPPDTAQKLIPKS